MARPIGIGHNGGPPLEPEDTDLDAEAALKASLYAELEGKSVQDILRDGQKHLFIDLVVSVRMGTASHNEKAILRNLLKDNGLTLGIPPEKGPGYSEPAELPDVPDFGTPDYV